MAFLEIPRRSYIPAPGPFIYYPRFSTPSCSRNFLSTLLWNLRSSAPIDNEVAGPLAAKSDEILEGLDDENYFSSPSVVHNEVNDGRIPYKRTPKRSENIVLNRFGCPTQSDNPSSSPQNQPITRIVKRRENLAPCQNFHRTQKNPNERNRPKPRACRDLAPGEFFCAFCLSNGESEAFYKAHPLKDEQNRVICPILRKYICESCGATGESAHTSKYCPKNPTPLPKFKPIRLNAAGKRVVSYN